VNNTGVMLEGFAEETGPAEARTVFETDLFGAVGAVAAWVGEPGEAFYAASKAALTRRTEALRHEVWHLGIWVSLVEPGLFVADVPRSPTTADPGISGDDGPRKNAAWDLAR
jgi:NAD(P)-dependent dehydrogenase (short-subunit alcohol dehydrogenase family)